MQFYTPPQALRPYIKDGVVDTGKRWADEIETRLQEAFGKHVSPERRRLIYAVAANQRAYNRGVLQENAARRVFDVDGRVQTNELVTSANFDVFTNNIVATVRDIFQDFDFFDVVTTRPMTGRTGYIAREQLVRQEASEFYDAGSALIDGLDPSYSECPQECEAANTVGLTVNLDLMEAECRRLAWEYCLPSNWIYQSEYGGNLDAALDRGIRLETRRAILADGLSRIVANAGGTQSWPQTPPAGSYFETANPREWRQELMRRIRQANRNIINDPGGRTPGRVLLGDVNAIGILNDIRPMELNAKFMGQGADTTRATVDEFTNYYGRMGEGLLDVYQFVEGMPEDTLILMAKDDNDPTYVVGLWVPWTSLGTQVFPKLAKVEGGGMTLYAQAALRPNRIQEIQIGD